MRQSGWHGCCCMVGQTCISGVLICFKYIEEIPMTLATVLLVVLIVMLVAAIPSWPYSQSWGYWPSGGLGLVVIVVILLLLMGRI